jgi:F1F0 ATPase subunit 2
MTNAAASTLLYLSIGIGAGALYFAGLRWTVDRLNTVRRPGLWTLASFLLRAAMLVTVFGAVGQGRWERIIACLAGFTIVRLAALRRLAPCSGRKDDPAAG